MLKYFKQKWGRDDDDEWVPEEPKKVKKRKPKKKKPPVVDLTKQKNIPMVDHNKEHPDFTIGRWMFNPRARISALGSGINASMEVNAPSIVEYQNSTDRVAYHNLMPQDKLHTLRLKMYCRVRKYNASSDEFSMDTFAMPTTKTDWWHCRLHFVSKD